MRRLLRAVKSLDSSGNRAGILVYFLVDRDERSLFIAEADLAGLSNAEIRALAKNRMNTATEGAAGPPQTVFDINRESKDDFDNLPNWDTWTGAEAVDHINSNVLSGMTPAETEAWVDANVTDLASAKEALKIVGRELAELRGFVEKAAQAIMYLRDINL